MSPQVVIAGSWPASRFSIFLGGTNKRSRKHFVLPTSDIPAVQAIALAALAIAKTDDGQAAESPPLPCPRCGGLGLRLIASGMVRGGQLILIADDGFHVVDGVASDADGSIVVMVFACDDCGKAITERTRQVDGGVRRLAVWTDLPPLENLIPLAGDATGSS